MEITVASQARAAIATPYEQYRLIASPDADFCREFEELKTEFRTKFDYHEPETGIPVAAFAAAAGMEETLIRWMHRIISAQNCIRGAVNNYSGIPSHTVYLRIMDAIPFQQVSASLRSLNPYLGGCGFDNLRELRPCLPLATGLSSDIYYRALKIYARENYHRQFRISSIALVRPGVAGQKPAVLNIFQLRP